MIKRKPHSLSVAFFALMILAVMVKVAIPAGFMPSNEGGLTKLVICSGMGEKTIFVADDDSGAQEHEDSTSELCSYQIFSAQKTIPTPAFDLARVFVFQSSAYAALTSPQIKTSPLLSFAARGPPSA